MQGAMRLPLRLQITRDEFTAAGMYKWNVKGFDLQGFGGIMKNNLTAGLGWAGNLGLAGFKGEFELFLYFKTE